MCYPAVAAWRLYASLNLAGNDSHNGCSPPRRKFIIWNNVGSSLNHGKNVSEIVIRIRRIFKHVNEFENIFCKISTILFQPQSINMAAKADSISRILVLCTSWEQNRLLSCICLNIDYRSNPSSSVLTSNLSNDAYCMNKYIKLLHTTMLIKLRNSSVYYSVLPIIFAISDAAIFIVAWWHHLVSQNCMITQINLLLMLLPHMLYWDTYRSHR